MSPNAQCCTAKLTLGAGVKRAPIRITLFCWPWWPRVCPEALLSCREIAEVALSLTKGDVVCPAAIVWILILNRIVFPKTDRAYVVRTRRTLVECQITATRAGEFLGAHVPAPNGLRFSCGPRPAAAQMNLFLWLSARQLQAPG